MRGATRREFEAVKPPRTARLLTAPPFAWSERFSESLATRYSEGSLIPRYPRLAARGSRERSSLVITKDLRSFERLRPRCGLQCLRRRQKSATSGWHARPAVLRTSPEIEDFWCADESFALVNVPGTLRVPVCERDAERLVNAGVRREGGRFHRPPLTWRQSRHARLPLSVRQDVA